MGNLISYLLRKKIVIGEEIVELTDEQLLDYARELVRKINWIN